MADAGEVLKRVRVRFVWDDARAERGGRRLERRLRSIDRLADRARRSVGGLARVMFSPVGLVAGGAGLFGAVGIVKHLVGIGRAGEDARNSLTTMLLDAAKASNLPIRSFGEAQKVAGGLRREFEQIAIKSPATADAIQQAFGLTTSVLSKRGVSLADQVKLARDVASRERVSGLQQGVAGRDVQQLLTGNFSAAEISLLPLKDLANDEGFKDLVKGGRASEAIERIQMALRLSKEELDAFGRSTTGMMSSMEDRFTQLRRKAAKPLMNFLNSKLAEALDWLDKNEQKANEIATAIGNGIVGAIQKGIQLVKLLRDNWGTVETIVKGLAITWIGGALVSAMMKVIGLAKGLGGVLGAVGLKIGGLRGALGSLMRGAGLGALAGAGIGLLIGEGVNYNTENMVQGFQTRELQRRGGRSEAESKRLLAAVRANKGREMAAAHRARVAEKHRRLASPIQALIDAQQDTLLNQAFDPVNTALKSGGGGKVRRLEVERMEVRDRDFARLSAPFIASARMEARAKRPLTDLGLGAVTLGAY